MREVECLECGEIVYYLKDGVTAMNAIKSSDYIPARVGIPQPGYGDEIVCPVCGSKEFLNSLRKAVAKR